MARQRLIKIEDLEKRYDEVLTDLVKKLKDLLKRLYDERDKTKKERLVAIKNMHIAKKGKFDEAKAVYDARVSEMLVKGVLSRVSSEQWTTFQNAASRVKELEGELGRLLDEEIPLEGQAGRLFGDEEKSVDMDIVKITQIGDLVVKKTGVGKNIVVKLFSRESGKNIRLLDVGELREIYSVITEVYNHLRIRGEESRRVESHIEPMLRQVNQAAQNKISAVETQTRYIQDILNHFAEVDRKIAEDNRQVAKDEREIAEAREKAAKARRKASETQDKADIKAAEKAEKDKKKDEEKAERDKKKTAEAKRKAKEKSQPPPTS